MATGLVSPALDGVTGIAMQFVQPATFNAQQYQAFRRERDYIQEDAKRFQSILIQSTLTEKAFTEYDQHLQSARAAVSEFNKIICEHKAMKFNFMSPLEKISHRKEVRAAKKKAVRTKDMLSKFIDKVEIEHVKGNLKSSNRVVVSVPIHDSMDNALIRASDSEARSPTQTLSSTASYLTCSEGSGEVPDPVSVAASLSAFSLKSGGTSLGSKSIRQSLTDCDSWSCSSSETLDVESSVDDELSLATKLPVKLPVVFIDKDGP
ncbi:hypothetical protein BT96DRAFT_925923 [Gymnopus androsaceus JB14]|uniref:Uncharacterized protein n=1 Tax=Gymnopus androsaceus JB14 TaxID=1447944 RepID=A0A6A4GY71_9AGAR|nr:hypothetical protein BT96DRAFT_925923 [Gymnopus androsaceus JB14]